MSVTNFNVRIGARLPYTIQQRNEHYNPVIVSLPLILTAGTIIANVTGLGATIMSCPKVLTNSVDYAHLGAFSIMIGGMPISIIAYSTDLFFLFKNCRTMSKVSNTCLINVGAQLLLGFMAGTLSASPEVCNMNAEQSKYAFWVMGLQFVCIIPLLINSNLYFTSRNAR